MSINLAIPNLYNWKIKQKLIHYKIKKSKSRKQIKKPQISQYYQMYNKMMLPIELTKILYQNW